MGPVSVTADERDAGNLTVKCWVNKDLRQDANTSDLIFDIPTLIETLSAGITLRPGDIIATGTPQGVGIGFDPPKFLKRGDTVTIEIAGRSEEHTSELQSLMRISYAVFCLKQKKNTNPTNNTRT